MPIKFEQTEKEKKSNRRKKDKTNSNNNNINYNNKNDANAPKMPPLFHNVEEQNAVNKIYEGCALVSRAT